MWNDCTMLNIKIIVNIFEKWKNEKAHNKLYLWCKKIKLKSSLIQNHSHNQMKKKKSTEMFVLSKIRWINKYFGCHCVKDFSKSILLSIVSIRLLLNVFYTHSRLVLIETIFAKIKCWNKQVWKVYCSYACVRISNRCSICWIPFHVWDLVLLLLFEVSFWC